MGVEIKNRELPGLRVNEEVFSESFPKFGNVLQRTFVNDGNGLMKVIARSSGKLLYHYRRRNIGSGRVVEIAFLDSSLESWWSFLSRSEGAVELPSS